MTATAAEQAPATVRRTVRRLVPALLLLLAVVCAQWLVDYLEQADRAVAWTLAAQRVQIERLGRELADAVAAPARGGGPPARLLEEAAAARRVAGALEPPVEPWDTAAAAPVAEAVAVVERAWGAYEARLAEGLALLGAARELHAEIERFQSVAAGILVTADTLVGELESGEAEREQLHAAGRQVLLAQRMRAGAHRLLEGGAGALAAADRFGRDVVVLGEVNNALLNGNRGLRIARVEPLDARALLESIGRDFRRGTVLVEAIMRLVARAAELPDALASAESARGGVARALADLRHAHHVSVGSRWLDRRTLRVGASLALLALLIAALAATRADARAAGEKRLRADREARDGEREGRLDAGLADVQRVLEAWAGGALDAGLRDRDALPAELVAALDRARHGIGGVVDGLREEVGALEALVARARGRAARLASSAGSQAERAEAASRAALDVRASFEPLSAQLVELADTVRGATGTVRAATAPVRDSLAGLDEMSRSVGTTSDRVRRLTQELHVLRDLCELLDEVGDQAKLLSVNVAIQASMDTESGRALANFSDDVQRLSEQARHGLRRMESARELLQGIAGEALEAIKRGAWSADAAAAGGRAADQPLASLEREIAGLEQLQRSLDSAARAHALNVDESARAMSGVSALADEVRDGAVACADTTARLEELAGRALAVAARLDPVSAEPAQVIRLGVHEGGAARDDEAHEEVARARAAGVLRPFEPRD